MKNDVLNDIGLSEHQAAAYTYLLAHGPTPPPVLAAKLKLTRSNAYKVLDQLIEMGLASRVELNKKLHYRAEDPIALTAIAAEERNRVIALEQHVKQAMSQLRQVYKNTAAATEVQTYQGAEAVKTLYENQAGLKQPIYFIKTRADIPSLGFEAMDYIRRLPAKHGTQRYAITPDAVEGVKNPELDKRTNLRRTWVKAEDYTSPVEWTVAGDELMIINFEDEASALRIKNPAIADSFRQLWQVLDKNLRAHPEYKKLPRRAKRQI